MASLFVDRWVVEKFTDNPKYINGLPGSAKIYPEGLGAVGDIWFSAETGYTYIKMRQFPRGSVAVVFTAPDDGSQLQQLQQQLRETILKTPSLLAGASTADLNWLLYRCNQEELDASLGKRGAYEVPGYGPLVYCGLVGAAAVFDKARRLLPREQLQQPISQNLMEGTWLLEYMIDRLTEPALLPLQQQMQETLRLLQQLKGYPWIRPYITDRLISGVYAQAGALVLSRLPGAASTATAAASAIDPLLLHLLTATLQFYGRVPSAPIVWGTNDPSLCAGLPHFTTGFMRNWGRDTFIALNGNLIITG